jgi:hypothetical protein
MFFEETDVVAAVRWLLAEWGNEDDGDAPIAPRDSSACRAAETLRRAVAAADESSILVIPVSSRLARILWSVIDENYRISGGGQVGGWME